MAPSPRMMLVETIPVFPVVNDISDIKNIKSIETELRIEKAIIECQLIRERSEWSHIVSEKDRAIENMLRSLEELEHMHHSAIEQSADRISSLSLQCESKDVVIRDMFEKLQVDRARAHQLYQDEVGSLRSQLSASEFESKRSALFLRRSIDSLESSCESLRTRLESVRMGAEDNLTHAHREFRTMRAVHRIEKGEVEKQLFDQTSELENSQVAVKKQKQVIVELKSSLETSKSQFHRAIAQLREDRASFEDRICRQEQESHERFQAAMRRIETSAWDKELLERKIKELETEISKTKSASPATSGEEIQQRIRAIAKENLDLKERVKESVFERTTAERLHKEELKAQEKKYLDLKLENKRLVALSAAMEANHLPLVRNIEQLTSEVNQSHSQLAMVVAKNKELEAELSVKKQEAIGFSEALVHITIMTEYDTLRQPDPNSISQSLKQTLDELRDIRDLVTQAEDCDFM